MKITVVNRCEGNCCNIQADKPCHVYSSSTQNAKRQGKQWRTFQRKWFKEHRWLRYCNTHNVTSCLYCRKAKLQGFLTCTKKAELLKMHSSPKDLITGKRPKKNVKNMKKASVIKKHLWNMLLQEILQAGRLHGRFWLRFCVLPSPLWGCEGVDEL